MDKSNYLNGKTQVRTILPAPYQFYIEQTQCWVLTFVLKIHLGWPLNPTYILWIEEEKRKKKSTLLKRINILFLIIFLSLLYFLCKKKIIIYHSLWNRGSNNNYFLRRTVTVDSSHSWNISPIILMNLR